MGFTDSYFSTVAFLEGPGRQEQGNARHSVSGWQELPWAGEEGPVLTGSLQNTVIPAMLCLYLIV